MKVFTRLLYVLIFIFSAIYVFKLEKYAKRIEIQHGYPVKFSVNRGENLEFYLDPKQAHKKGIVCIYNLHNKIVDSLVLDLIVQTENKDSLLYAEGYKYTNKFNYNTSKLRSGIYLLGNVIPFLVKENELKNSITVVFPFANFMALNNEGGKSFDMFNSSFNIAAKKLSLHRGLQLRNDPFNFLLWIDSVYHKMNVNYIADSDLNEYKNIESSRMLVLYGYQSFWTYEQRVNFDNFILKGGNVLAICSYLMNNKFNINSNQDALVFYKSKSIKYEKEYKNKLGIWSDILPNTISVGCSYELGYATEKPKLSFGGLKIINNNHPIFNEVTTTTIPLDASNSNSIEVEDINFEKNPIAKQDSTNFVSKEILAYDYSFQNNKQTLTGIFLMQKKINSGKLLIIGNEKWCWKDNFNQSSIRKVTENSINFLLN